MTVAVCGEDSLLFLLVESEESGESGAGDVSGIWMRFFRDLDSEGGEVASSGGGGKGEWYSVETSSTAILPCCCCCCCCCCCVSSSGSVLRETPSALEMLT